GDASPDCGEPDIDYGAIDKGQAGSQNGGREHELRMGGRLPRRSRPPTGSVAKRVEGSGHVFFLLPTPAVMRKKGWAGLGNLRVSLPQFLTRHADIRTAHRASCSRLHSPR